MPNNIFAISQISAENNRYCFIAEVDVTSHILKGHFEGQPVVPGVCTLTMIKQCICSVLQRDSVQYESIKECKFLATIIPAEHTILNVTIDLKEDRGVIAEVLYGEKKMMKLKAVIS
ncbi:MAG: hypothetical protein SNH27_06215 [Rikenellaceae bacterium]